MLLGCDFVEDESSWCCGGRGRGSKVDLFLELGFTYESGFGFEPSTLPLSHVAQGGAIFGVDQGLDFWLVGGGIYAHFVKPLLEVSVPVVLDLIVCSLGQVRCYG